MELFNLLARISLDSSEYKKQLGEAGEDTKSFGSKLKSGLAAAGKAVAVGLGAAGTAVVAVGKKAVDAYANYEQLVGGVETMFEDLSWDVEQNAKNAFKTAGLSANEYMETVMGFSAALNQSLKASEGNISRSAELSNIAVTDMADNANKMGTSMEAIQNAYQGFAKQNFTMLDNLKLGYGGTKGEMERLLADAEKISGIKYDVSSFSDIVDAIHVMQTDMHISGLTAEEAAEAVRSGAMTEEEAFAAMGTTAKEASSTIQGSLSSAKAALANLLTGLTDENANLSELINNFFDSLGTAASNLIPRLSQVLNGISTLISELAPKLAAEVPKLLDSILPGLISGAVGLLDSLVNSLPKIIDPLLTTALPQLLTGVEQLFYSVTEALPGLIKVVTDALPVLIPQIIEAATKLVIYLIEHIDEILVPLIQALPSIFLSIIQALFSALPQLLNGLKSLVESLFTSLIPTLFAAYEEFYGTILGWIGDLFKNIWTKVKDSVSNGWEAIKKPFVDGFNKISEVFHTVIDPWIEIIKRASKLVYDHVIKPVTDYFSGLWESLKEKASDAWEGIKNAFKPVADWFHDIFSTAWQKVKDVFSTGGKVFDGIKEGIENTFKTVVNALIGGINKIIAVPFKAINKILEKIHSIEILGVSPFDWVHTFEIPEMPKLAKGGIVNRPVIAGEAGAEAIVPLERNTEWIQSVVKQLEESSSSSENIKLMRVLVDEMQSMRQSMYEVILAALRTNSDEFDGSERDLIRLVKKYAFT